MSNSQTGFVVIFNDGGATGLEHQMRNHLEHLQAELTSEQLRALAYVEGALVYGSPDIARIQFDYLDERTQNSSFGQALNQRIAQRADESLWWPRVHAAMRAHLGGKTKMSRSGEVVIFSEPQCGRHDLAGWRRQAERQLESAGIDLKCTDFGGRA